MYDLTVQSWIPIQSLSGYLARVNLGEVFAYAHKFRRFEHPIPIVELGVWRLAIAIATDVLQPDDDEELRSILSRGRFEVDPFAEYLQKNVDRFDLFSAKHPFLQNVSASSEKKPLAALSPLVPSGTNSAHWHKGDESAFSACPGCAALLVTTIAPAMTAGGAGLSPTINGAPPYYALLVGRTLFESIVLNVWANRPGSYRGGMPAWRSGRAPDPTKRRTKATLLEAYSWQPRTLRLLPGESGKCSLCGERAEPLVRTMYFAKGDSCAIEEWRDPNVAYVITPEKTTPLRPRKDRDPWRDLDALLLLPDKNGSMKRRTDRPAIVSQYVQMSQAKDFVAPQMRLRLFGMRTDLKMKVFEWRAEDLVLPTPLIPNEKLYRTLVTAVSAADATSRALAGAIRRATERGSFDHRDLANSLVVPALRRYWAALRPDFDNLAARVAFRDPRSEAGEIEQDVLEWATQRRRAAHDAFDAAIESLRMNAAQLMASEHARRWLHLALAGVDGYKPKAA